MCTIIYTYVAVPTFFFMCLMFVCSGFKDADKKAANRCYCCKSPLGGSSSYNKHARKLLLCRLTSVAPSQQCFVKLFTV